MKHQIFLTDKRPLVILYWKHRINYVESNRWGEERETINYVVHPYTFDSSLQETNFPSVIFIFQFEEEEDEGEDDEVCLWYTLYSGLFGRNAGQLGEGGKWRIQTMCVTPPILLELSTNENDFCLL